MPGASEEPAQEGGGRSASARGLMATGNAGPDWDGLGHAGPGQDRPDASPREAPGRVGVLADRIAAALVHHEPGWRLPRHTALARRYNVTTAEIDAAVNELATRHLIRRLADGQLYRVSPAEYLIPIEGLPGLGLARRPDGRVPHLPEPAGVLAPGSRGHRVGPADPARRPGRASSGCSGRRAVSPRRSARPTCPRRWRRRSSATQGAPPAASLTLLPIAAPPARPMTQDGGDLRPVGEPRAVHIEMQPPPAVRRPEPASVRRAARGHGHRTVRRPRRRPAGRADHRRISGPTCSGLWSCPASARWPTARAALSPEPGHTRWRTGNLDPVCLLPQQPRLIARRGARPQVAPGERPGSRELMAALAVAAVLVHLLLAQLTLVLAGHVRLPAGSAGGGRSGWRPRPASGCSGSWPSARRGPGRPGRRPPAGALLPGRRSAGYPGHLLHL